MDVAAMGGNGRLWAAIGSLNVTQNNYNVINEARTSSLNYARLQLLFYVAPRLFYCFLCVKIFKPLME